MGGLSDNVGAYVRLNFVFSLLKGEDVNSSARQVIELMNSYNLTREDWESFIEIGKWDTQQDISASIPSKVCFPPFLDGDSLDGEFVRLNFIEFTAQRLEGVVLISLLILLICVRI